MRGIMKEKIFHNENPEFPALELLLYLSITLGSKKTSSEGSENSLVMGLVDPVLMRSGCDM
jgi:hypothetical protein